MDDTISRQAAIDALVKRMNCDWHSLKILQPSLRVIEQVPSAEPHWIPCSDRLPEKDGYYLTTTCYRQVYCDFWNEDHFDRTEAVIAWMPLPEPYDGEC